MSGTSPKIKVAAYCRVSTDKDDQLASLEAQKEFFKNYARLNDFELVELYADEGISGTKLKNRAAFRKMLADAREGRFERVFVKDISRFSRNALDFLKSIRELKAMGIKCDFVNSNLSTEDGEFTLGVLALVAQEESANISRRVKFGKAKNAKNGKVPNFVYGYDKLPGELFRLVINEEEAEVVRRIYHLYADEEYGAGKIAGMLNDEGVRTKRGNPWSQNAVSRILSNPIYTGKVINGKEEVADFLTGVRAKTSPENWHISENPELKIISQETFEKAGELLETRRGRFKTQKIRESGRYPFSTLIKCGCCGYSFRRITKQFATKKYIKWACSGRNAKGKEFCKNRTIIDEETLLSRIKEYITGLYPSEEKLLKETEEEVQRQSEKSPRSVCRKTIAEELLRLRRAKARQTQMYEAEVISLEELKNRAQELNEAPGKVPGSHGRGGGLRHHPGGAGGP